MTSSEVSIIEIARGVGDGETRFERFEVPYTPGASVLDGLMWIREHTDPGLAFRYSCINANVCRECVMTIDGRVGYACVERLHPGSITIAPLANKPLIRDLVCDTISPKERL